MEHNIHDNFVYAVSIDLEQRVLILHTQYRDGSGPHEFTDVCFKGVVAHFLEHVTAPSILFGIYEISAEMVVAEWHELFDRGIKYGWPLFNFNDLDDLCRLLKEQNVVGFRVNGSCGLGGFVLALEVESRSRPEAANLLVK